MPKEFKNYKVGTPVNQLQVCPLFKNTTAWAQISCCACGNKINTMANKHISLVKSAFRLSLHLSQREYADWLGISRSVLNMFENGKRSLPLQAHLKHSQLVAAQHQLSVTSQTKALPGPVDTEACCGLLKRHLTHCNNTLKDLQRQQRRMDTRHQKLHGRREALLLIQSCSGPGCTTNEEKWLADKCAANDHAVSCSQPAKLFLLQHKINMLQTEIAATQQAMAGLKEG